jgi:hypothetical protein
MTGLPPTNHRAGNAGERVIIAEGIVRQVAEQSDFRPAPGQDSGV